jgi:hypothetical protein
MSNLFEFIRVEEDVKSMKHFEGNASYKSLGTSDINSKVPMNRHVNIIINIINILILYTQKEFSIVFYILHIFEIHVAQVDGKEHTVSQFSDVVTHTCE